MSGERIDIVPWHPDPEIYAKRALAPAKVAKVISETEQKVITAIVDEDQLSLAIGRNGQNVRLASQLIGWQIDLYSSREWMERGAQVALFGGGEEEERAADFPLAELDIPPAVLASLQAAGHETFLNIIDLERDDFLRIAGLNPEDAELLEKLIEELTIVEEPVELSEKMPAHAKPVATGGPFADIEDEVEEAAAEASDSLEPKTAEGGEVAVAATGNGEPTEQAEVTAEDAAATVEEVAPVAEADVEVVAEGESDEQV
jgi:N utilization substance protein A